MTNGMSMSLWKNKVNRHNLMATCYLWASSGFIGYLIAYYSKYFKGDVFVNFTMAGLSDSLSMLYAAALTARFSLQTSILIFYILIIFLSILMTLVLNNSSEEMALYLVPIFVLAVRLQSSALQNYGYQIVQDLFSVLLRGQVYGITNLVSRPFSALSTILTEYTRQPLMYCVFASLGIFAFVRIIEVPKNKY